MRLHPLCFLIALLVPLAACAQTTEGDRVTVVDLSGAEISGRIRQLSQTALTLAGQPATRIETDNLLSLRFDSHAPRESASGPLVLLAGGDRLQLQAESLDEDHLTGAWSHYPAWPKVEVPLELVRAVALAPPENAAARRRLLAGLAEYREARDTVIFRNGDRLGGRLIAMTADALSFEGPVGQLEIPRNSIRALALNSQLLSVPDDSGRRVLLKLDDGSRITARRAVWDEPGVFDVQTQFRAELRVPASAVVSLRFLGGRAVYLSDLMPAAYEFTPFLSTRWPLRTDRNVLGGLLRLRGREFAKGLGMHSRSAVSYNLAGKYGQFRATVGIDDSADGGGSVRFAVELDGRRVFTSEAITGGDQPVAVGPLDVTGGKRLTLIVEFGALGDILDHADWCDPVLIR